MVFTVFWYSLMNYSGAILKIITSGHFKNGKKEGSGFRQVPE